MDIRDRALLDLRNATNAGPPIRPRYDPKESRYLDFKQRLHRLMREGLGEAGMQSFLSQYFLEFLPVLLRAAAEHEGLSPTDCAYETQLLDEVLRDQRGHLSHSPIIFPLNRKVLRPLSHLGPSLDLGIGSGSNSEFSLEGRTVDIGADIMVSNLFKARQRQRHRHFAALDMGALPFRDHSFRRVYALNCLYHVQAGRLKALEEIARVLRPGGIVAITDVSPFLSDFKPLGQLLASLGFTTLADEFRRYFLSGFGADGTPGEAQWYRDQLFRLGFENIETRYFLSPQLTHVAYLFYDWQALFNLDAQAQLAGPEGHKRMHATYKPMLMSLVPPLLKVDEELCWKEQRGGYLFVTAQLKGFDSDPSTPERVDDLYACVACHGPLQAREQGLSCQRCSKFYPVVDGVPLLTSFYADAADSILGSHPSVPP